MRSPEMQAAAASLHRGMGMFASVFLPNVSVSSPQGEGVSRRVPRRGVIGHPHRPLLAACRQGKKARPCFASACVYMACFYITACLRVEPLSSIDGPNNPHAPVWEDGA